jgi:dihydroorotate dehydrogenase (NAD+) catalytic subunit
VKPKRRALTAKSGMGGRTSRTPTVRRIKPAIASALPKAAAPSVVPAQAPFTAAPSPGAVDALGGRPVSLEVDLGRGLVLENPMIVASGPFGYGVEVVDAVDLGRLGAIVTRSTTLKPRAGHPAPRMADVPAGVLLGMGLQNPGIDLVIERYAPTWATWPVPVIVSLAGESASDIADTVRRLDGVPGVSGIELNLSAPNGSRGGSAFGMDAEGAASFVRAVRRATDLPLIAKLTASAADVRAVARAVEDEGADAIAAINTLPGLALAPDRTGPALGSGYGGLSGPALRPIALRVVFEVAQVVDIPVIGIGGITTIEDVLDLLAAGATAVGVGIAALADPMLPVRLADELADACRALGLSSFDGFVGTALPKRPSPPSSRGAEYAR